MKFDITYENIRDNNFLVFRPSEKLSDTEYDKIKPHMESMGGHWSEKVGGFIFLQDYLERDNYAQRREDLQFFPTPKSVAKRVAELSELNKICLAEGRPFVLEPSAGTGSLLEALPSHVKRYMRCYVVEPDEDNASFLMSLGYPVDEMTFEQFYKEHKKEKKEITHVVMNPPFSKQRDINHIKMAYDLLVHGGILVAIIPENRLYYKDKDSVEFVKWLKDHNAYTEDVEYGAFRDSGTTIDTVIVKVIKE